MIGKTAKSKVVARGCDTPLRGYYQPEGRLAIELKKHKSIRAEPVEASRKRKDPSTGCLLSKAKGSGRTITK